VSSRHCYTQTKHPKAKKKQKNNTKDSNVGCIQAHWMVQDELDCPFCRVVATDDDKEYIQRIEKRAAVNDAEAIQFLAGKYSEGGRGLKQDHVKAMALWMKASKLGSALASRNIGAAYYDGRGVQKNAAKEKYFHELAAIGGYMNSRCVLYLRFLSKTMYRRQS
jgi:TPR repeat protein